MKNTLTRISPLLLRLCSIAALAFLVGCTSVSLMSDYDESIDKGATEFHKLVETFLVGIERDGRNAGPLTESEKAFFKKAAVELSSLSVRASAHDKNELTKKMIANLADSMSTLEELVPLGVTRDQVKPVRSALTTSISAIIQLEVAKKRGATTNK